MTTILITRPIDQAEPLKSQLESLCATVLLQPTIQILPIEHNAAVDKMFAELESFDWIVFSSVNGVRSFFDLLKTSPLQSEDVLSTMRFAVVGPGTDDELREQFGRKADLIPDVFTAEGLAEKLSLEAKSGRRFLLPRGNRGRNVLRRSLVRDGGSVVETVVYRSVDTDRPDPNIVMQLQQGKIDYVTATSSSIAASLVRLFGDLLRQTKIVSISPITTKTLRENGFAPDLEAETASIQGIVDVLDGQIVRS